MKSLLRAFGLTVLSLTLTNCSLSPEQIASRLEPKRQKKNEVSLVSAKGVDYRKLRDLLKAKKWKEADEETRVKILKVANRESEGWLRQEDAENFSCQDLGTIDKLWVKYSNGKFGFSVQKQIYQGMNGSKEFNWDDY
ncbi:MAG: GUN4 domain-containing protein, partial [Trichodesmium sp. St2_bin2_1]|nr:GUN4 domain-containing protein [Trichodesmium sp. St2_bin2_1]